MTLSTRRMRTEWSEYECTTTEWVTIEFLGRSPVKTIKRLVDAWSAAERALLNTGYPKASIVGSYACRDIRGGTGRSLHAFRLALDIDPSLNFRQGKGATMDWDKCRITPHQVDAVEAIRTHSGVQVFRNGFVFKNPDPMHFQIACRKADIDSGINWVTVFGAEDEAHLHPTPTKAPTSQPGDSTSPTTPRTEEDTLFSEHGDGISNDKTDTVRYWQTKLVALGQDTGGIDGHYGDATKAAVQAIVAGSPGMRIGGEEAAQIDVALAKLGPDAEGVSHQHEEYAPAEHTHGS